MSFNLSEKSNSKSYFRKTTTSNVSKERNVCAAAAKTKLKELDNAIVPAVDTAFKALLSARFCSAVWAFISDCDETFNYWEPLHYMIFGLGLQTWEYSPEFALRSYTYLMTQGVPAWVYYKVFNPTPIVIFYFIRCILGLGCAIVECYLYKAICREFGVHVGRLWLMFQLFSAGMFISSTAMLPSSFSMYLGSAALAAWWHKKYRLSIYFTAISALLGWPFSVLIGVPIAIDMLIRRVMWKTFALWTLISAVTILIPMIAIDSAYFGKITLAPLNIILYNVFTDHGPNLYGTEPVSYYLINGFLNFNLIWVFALITPIMLLADKFLIPAKTKSTLNFSRCLSISPLYLWLLVFFMQPHKEERFLFPVYPLISLCGAITVDIIQKLYFRLKDIVFKDSTGGHYLDKTMFVAVFITCVSSLIGLSRIFALYRNYHAPMDLLIELNNFKNSPSFKENQIYNVCIGKDWYRYPTSFFLPSENFRIRFLKSEFKGMLPAYYSEYENATSIVHTYFNDMNQENEFMYFDYQKCHFLLDLDTGRYSELEPDYSARNKEWTVVKSLPFLIPEKSQKIFRAFYVPFISDHFIIYGNFNLLRRKKIKFS